AAAGLREHGAWGFLTRDALGAAGTAPAPLDAPPPTASHRAYPYLLHFMAGAPPPGPARPGGGPPRGWGPPLPPLPPRRRPLPRRRRPVVRAAALPPRWGAGGAGHPRPLPLAPGDAPGRLRRRRGGGRAGLALPR